MHIRYGAAPGPDDPLVAPAGIDRQSSPASAETTRVGVAHTGREHGGVRRWLDQYGRFDPGQRISGRPVRYLVDLSRPVLQSELKGKRPGQTDERLHVDREDIARVPPYEREALRTHQSTGSGHADLEIGRELPDIAAGQSRANDPAAHVGDEIYLDVRLSLSGSQIERTVAPLPHTRGQTNQPRDRGAKPSSPRALVPSVHQGERRAYLGIAPERHRGFVGPERQ